MVVTQPQAEQSSGSAACPHQGCLSTRSPTRSSCARATARRFSITDGSVRCRARLAGLSPVPVVVDGDQIVLG